MPRTVAQLNLQNPVINLSLKLLVVPTWSFASRVKRPGFIRAIPLHAIQHVLTIKQAHSLSQKE